jgi:hypothetical protein
MKTKIKLHLTEWGGEYIKAALLVMAVIMLSLNFGCHTAKLEQGGAYNQTTTNIITGTVESHPDIAFFAVDSAFDFAYKTVDSIFLFEQKNRDALWAISHNIKHSLDQARPVAADIVRRYLMARAVYESSPTPANLKSLQGLLSEIQKLVASVQAALPK